MRCVNCALGVNSKLAAPPTLRRQGVKRSWCGSGAIYDARIRNDARRGDRGIRLRRPCDDLYNYFSTKPNLLMELALRHVRAALPERRAFLKNLPESPLEGIEAFKRLLTEQALRRLSRECWRTMHQARGRLVADVDASTLSDLIVGVATMNFARFAFGPSGTIEDLLRIGVPHIALILRGLLPDKRSRPRRQTRME